MLKYYLLYVYFFCQQLEYKHVYIYIHTHTQINISTEKKIQ